jgi:hypothetical protein
MPFSEYFANKIAALAVNNTPIPAFSSPNRYVALHIADPTKTCAVGELSTGNYSRVLLPLDVVDGADGKDMLNDAVLVFPIGSQDIVQPIEWYSIWDSLNAGNPVSYGRLTTPVQWKNGSSLSFAINAFIQTVRTKIPA